MKMILCFVLYIVGSILLLTIILLLIILINSPGKSRPFLDQSGNKVPGSFADIVTMNINGIDQRMIIRGRDTTKPVLLYLHGGPGDPEFPFVSQFNSDIENIFVVCYWEQRGAGLSYSNKISPSSMTLNQFVEDAGKVTEYILQRFNRKKIFLLGHSWGSMLGAFTANKYPEYYHAFISVGQVGNQVRSENISYDFVLSRAKELKDKKAVSIIEKIGPPPYADPKVAINNLSIKRKYLIKYGGAIKNGEFYPKAAKSLFACKEYTFRDKINYLKGMSFTKSYLWDIVMKTNLFKEVPKQQIPVYILQGRFDYQTSYVVAQDYFATLEAPVKKFFTFENSAHSPIFEEPEKFEKILREILLEQQKNEK